MEMLKVATNGTSTIMQEKRSGVYTIKSELAVTVDE